MTAVRTTKSRPSATSSDLHVELTAGRPVYVMWDTFNRAIFIRGTEGMVRLDEPGVTSITVELEQTLGLRINRTELKHVLEAVAKKQTFDSANAWLDALPQWDGVTRVETFFATYFGTSTSRYNLAVARYFWTAAVARIRAPGCKADKVPILIGRQGVGKSTAISVLAPTPQHCGDASLTDRPASLARTVVGKTFLLWEEMRGIRGKCDADEVKTFITLYYTEARSSTGDGMDRYPRQFIIVGTSNRTDVLQDPTGNRRYLPIDIDQPIALDQLRADKEQLWAEALRIVDERQASNQTLVDYADAELLAPAEHRPFMREARWLGDPKLAVYLSRGTDKFTTEDALIAVGFRSNEITVAEKRDMVLTLKQLGYENRHSSVAGYKSNQRRWRAPMTAKKRASP